MSRSQSINLNLTNGSVNGLTKASLLNWIGNVLVAPRNKIAELVAQDECSETGIYFLFGKNGITPHIYIGTSTNLAEKLQEEDQSKDSNGGHHWDKVFVVTSRESNIGKAHLNYLRISLLNLAYESKNCLLTNHHTTNGKQPPPNLSESDKADMDFFLNQMKVALSVLGLEFLADQPI